MENARCGDSPAGRRRARWTRRATPRPRRRSRRPLPSKGPPILQADETGWPPSRAPSCLPGMVAGWKVELRLLVEDGHAATARSARWNVVGARATPADPLAGKIAVGWP